MTICLNLAELQQQAFESLVKGEYSTAIATYEQCIEAEPSNLANYWQLGLATLLQGDEMAAQAVWLSVLMQGSSEEYDVWLAELLQLLRKAVLRHLQIGNFQTAERICLQTLELEPNLPELSYYMGLCLQHRNKVDEAISYLEKEIKISPHFAEAYSSLGALIKKRDGELELAIKYIEKAIVLKLGFAEAHYNLATCLQDKGDLQAAIESLEKAIELKPQFTEAYYALGRCFQDEGRLEEAIEYLEKAIELNPESIQCYYALGRCFQDESRLEEAIEYLGKAIELNPEFAESYYALGRCFQDEGRLEEAIEYLEKAIELNPKSAEAYYALGRCFQDEGRLEEAIEYLEKAIELKSRFAEPYYTVARCLRNQGKIDEAISKLQEMLTIEIEPIKVLRTIEDLTKFEQVGYASFARKGYNVWDAMIFKDDDLYRLFYLVGDGSASPFWSVGQLSAAISYDLKKWEYLGVVLEPEHTSEWQSGRMLAGSLYKENSVYYFFYSASPPKPHIFEEGIGLATSVDGISWQRSSEQFIKLDPQFYCSSLRQGQQKHYGWRDPFIFKDPVTEKYYLFITTSCHSEHPTYKGCIGLAVSKQVDGPYEVLPPVSYPRIPNTEEGIYYEMERPQVIFKDGKYHLFFSTSPSHINPNWIKQVGRKHITNASLYWYISDKITGPFIPSSDLPIVKGSASTGLYGTSLIEAPDGKLVACGTNAMTFTLEVSDRFPVRWENDSIEILLE